MTLWKVYNKSLIFKNMQEKFVEKWREAKIKTNHEFKDLKGNFILHLKKNISFFVLKIFDKKNTIPNLIINVYSPFIKKQKEKERKRCKLLVNVMHIWLYRLFCFIVFNGIHSIHMIILGRCTSISYISLAISSRCMKPPLRSAQDLT